MNKRALVVGINNYKIEHLKLSAPEKDAQAIINLLDKYGDFTTIRALPENTQNGKSSIAENQRVSLNDLQQGLKDLFQNQADLALFYFSGHGWQKTDDLTDEKEGFLCPSDFKETGNSALSFKKLLTLLHKSPVHKKVVILDCCHAGELLNFESLQFKYDYDSDYLFLASSADFQKSFISGDSGLSDFTYVLRQALDPTLNNTEVTSVSLVNYLNTHFKNKVQSFKAVQPREIFQLTRCDSSEITDSQTIQKTEFDLTPYLQKLIDDFEHWQKVFVDIRGKFEDILIAKPHGASERKKYGDMEGTVNDIRQHITERQMVVIGNAGMGKTTTLQYLANIDAQKLLNDMSLLSKLHPLPIYVELRNFKPKQTLLDKVVCEVQTGLDILDFEKDNVASLRHFVERLLKAGKVTLFLDGLNEIPKDLRDEKIAEIQHFVNRDYSDVFYLLTSRKEQYRKVLTDIPAFDLQPMDLEQINLFLHRNTTQDVVRNTILDKVKTNPYLAQFVNIPFNLLMLIRVVEEKGDVPQSYPELLSVFIGHLYSLQRQKESHFNEEAVDLLLAHLAHETKEKYEANPELPKMFILNIFKQVKQDYGFELDLLDALQTVVSLNILRLDSKKYTFVHQLFLEYFAAMYYGDDEDEFED